MYTSLNCPRPIFFSIWKSASEQRKDKAVGCLWRGRTEGVSDQPGEVEGRDLGWGFGGDATPSPAPATALQGEGGTLITPSLSEPPSPLGAVHTSSDDAPLQTWAPPHTCLQPSVSDHLFFVRFCLHSRGPGLPWSLLTLSVPAGAGQQNRCNQHLRQQLANSQRRGEGGPVGSHQPQGSPDAPPTLTLQVIPRSGNLPSQGSIATAEMGTCRLNLQPDIRSPFFG